MQRGAHRKDKPCKKEGVGTANRERRRKFSVSTRPSGRNGTQALCQSESPYNGRITSNAVSRGEKRGHAPGRGEADRI